MRVTSSSSSVSRCSRSALCLDPLEAAVERLRRELFPGRPRGSRRSIASMREVIGRAQLVRRHGQELVPQPHRLLGLAQQARVVDGQRGAAADLGRQLQVGRPEPAGRRGRERQRAQRGVARDERHDDDAAGAEPRDQLGVMLVDGSAAHAPRR